MGPGSNKFNNVNSICVGEDGMNSLFECEYLDLYDENINNHLDRSRNILMNYAQNYEIPILYLFYDGYSSNSKIRTFMKNLASALIGEGMRCEVYSLQTKKFCEKHGLTPYAFLK